MLRKQSVPHGETCNAGVVHGAAGGAHVRRGGRAARRQLLPVPRLQEADAHRPQLRDQHPAAHRKEPRPLDPQGRRRAL